MHTTTHYRSSQPLPFPKYYWSKEDDLEEIELGRIRKAGPPNHEIHINKVYAALGENSRRPGH